MKKHAATILLLTYCLLFLGSSYHFHPQDPQAALHCKVCAVSEATILPLTTNLECNPSSTETLIAAACLIGSLDQVSKISARSPPAA